MCDSLNDLETLVENSLGSRTNSQSSSDNSNRSYLSKPYDEFNVKKLNSTADIFTVNVLQKQMERKEKARKIQNDYIEKIMKEGDVHYFRQQTFNTQFLRTVKCI